MTRTSRAAAAVLALAGAAVTLTACAGHSGARPATAARPKPGAVHIVSAPRSLLAAAPPQANGLMWALAGRKSTGLYEFDSGSGQKSGSVSVSNSARSVAESASGVIGLALAAGRSGALQLLDGRTAQVTATVPLPAPARQVVTGSDGTTFYVLTSWRKVTSVSIVDSRNGRLHGSIPVPSGRLGNAERGAVRSLCAGENRAGGRNRNLGRHHRLDVRGR